MKGAAAMWSWSPRLLGPFAFLQSGLWLCGRLWSSGLFLASRHGKVSVFRLRLNATCNRRRGEGRSELPLPYDELA